MPRYVALMAALFFASYFAAFWYERVRVTRAREAAARTVAQVPAEEEEPGQPDVAAFAETADRVTMGSGNLPKPVQGGLEQFDQMLRKLSALPDGAEKTELAQQVGAIRDPAAGPILLDWTVVTTDRAVLRSALDALGPIADAELIAEIKRRFAAAFRADDRYRLAKTIRNITNAEAVEALIELANDEVAPRDLSVAATDALATIATPPAVSLLLGKLQTIGPDDAPRLLTAIARIDRPEALAALQYAALGNKETPTDGSRVAVIQALGNFRDDETRDILGKLSGDPSLAVRAAARDILARIK